MVVEDIVVRISEKGSAKLKNLLALREDLLKIQTGGGNVDKSLARVNKRIDKLTGGAKGLALQFRRFKFEMLGVLFFGMAVTRFFKGLIKPGFDLIGTFEDLNLIIGIAFLDNAIKVNDTLLDMALSFSELDPWIRDAFCNFSLAAAGVGLLGTAAGVLALGLPSIATALGTTSLAVTAFGAEFIIVIAAVLFFIEIMKNWDEKSEGTKLALAGITGGLGLLGVALGIGSPFILGVLLAISAITLLRLNFDKLEEIANRDVLTGSAFGIGIQQFIKDTFELIGNLMEINELIKPTTVGLPEFNPNATAADVIAASSGGNQTGAFPPASNNFDIDINVSGITGDIVSMAEQIRRELNESIATQLEGIEPT